MGHGTEMEGKGRAVQVMMFISNFIMWIGSILVTTFGVLAIVDKPYLERVLDESIFESAAAILIIVGVLTFLISFLGFFGALKEIKCILLMYFIVVLLLSVILLVGGILSLVFRGKAELTMKNGMIRSMKDYRNEGMDLVTKAWDDAQEGMNCCGIYENEDWLVYSMNHFSLAVRVPESCCRKNSTGELLDCIPNPTSENSWTEGCLVTARDFAKRHSLYIGATGIVVATIMVLGLVFSLMLFVMIK